jgi:hypothetical protein
MIVTPTDGDIVRNENMVAKADITLSDAPKAELYSLAEFDGPVRRSNGHIRRNSQQTSAPPSTLINARLENSTWITITGRSTEGIAWPSPNSPAR